MTQVLVMETTTFTDYYEILEISPNASIETIDRVFRYLAQRYHPDNHQTGNHLKFTEVVRAHEVLRQPDSRAEYDLKYRHYTEKGWQIVAEASNKEGMELDVSIQEKLLALLYMKRRHNMQNPGIGNLELERLSGCPREHIDFHLWYLKEKGWIARMENGLMTITANGVDEAITEHHRITPAKRLTDQNVAAVSH